MVRYNRQLLRLFLLAIMLMALVGAWYADRTWQTLTSDLKVEVSTETDWISLIAGVLEDALKFFQGATAESP